MGKKHAPSQKWIAGLRGIPELQSLAARLLVKAGETRGSRSVRVQSPQQGRATGLQRWDAESPGRCNGARAVSTGCEQCWLLLQLSGMSKRDVPGLGTERMGRQGNRLGWYVCVCGDAPWLRHALIFGVKKVSLGWLHVIHGN